MDAASDGSTGDQKKKFLKKLFSSCIESLYALTDGRSIMDMFGFLDLTTPVPPSQSEAIAEYVVAQLKDNYAPPTPAKQGRGLRLC